MIIFDLDGTLANCEHRRHFVDRGYTRWQHSNGDYYTDGLHGPEIDWKPDWKAFYEACDQDIPIESPKIILYNLWVREGEDIQIWSGRCESVRDKTINWLNKKIFPYSKGDIPKLKMRPIGDNTPDDQLKERWLDEALARGEKIEFVFDSDPQSIALWRRRGIFVFDCNQTGREF